MCLYVSIKSDNISLSKLLLSTGGRSHDLVPCVQQHDVILAEVILSEVSHLSDDETARLIGAFEQSWLMIHNHQLKSVVMGSN